MVFCGLYPVDGRRVRRAARRDGQAAAQRRLLHLRARELGARSASASAAASSACSTWRSSRSGWSASSTSRLITTAPSVRLRASQRRTARSLEIDEPGEAARPRHEIDEIDEPYITDTIIAADEYVGRDHGPLRGAAGRAEEPSTWRPTACHARLRAAAGRSHLRLLRPAEVDRTQGYGTLDYDLIGYRRSDLVKLDILVNGDRWTRCR